MYGHTSSFLNHLAQSWTLFIFHTVLGPVFPSELPVWQSCGMTNVQEIFEEVIEEMKEQFGGRLLTPKELADGISVSTAESKNILQEYKKGLEAKEKNVSKPSKTQQKKIAQQSLPATVAKLPAESFSKGDAKKVVVTVDEATPSECDMLEKNSQKMKMVKRRPLRMTLFKKLKSLRKRGFAQLRQNCCLLRVLSTAPQQMIWQRRGYS